MSATTSAPVGVEQVGPLGCPEWCELDASEHAPQWHDGALRVDHEHVLRVEGVAVVAVGVEATYRPGEGDTLQLTMGGIGATVELVTDDPLTAQQLRALARALDDAAELVQLATDKGVSR